MARLRRAAATRSARRTQIAGRWYYPAEDYNYRETGIASWYGPKFHGRRTANGESFDMNELSAAHRTLPMPSVVRVTNLENGRSMVLRVNDRGPFARGRIIDVSRRAAQLLGFRRQGTAKVRVAIVADDSRRMKLAALNSPTGRTQQVQVAAAPRVAVEAAPLPGHAAQSGAADLSRQSNPAPRPVPGEPQLPTGVLVLPVSPSGIYVQAGAYARLENALKMRDRLYNVAPAQISRFTAPTGAVYRVRVGPLNSVASADRTLARIVECCMGQGKNCRRIDRWTAPEIGRPLP